MRNLRQFIGMKIRRFFGFAAANMTPKGNNRDFYRTGSRDDGTGSAPQAGFTLLETMAALALFVIVIMLVGSLYILAEHAYIHGSDESELIQNARVCLDRLSRELRQAKYLVTDTTSTSTEIMFQDGHNSDYISYIKYYLAGTDFYRSQIVYYFPPWPVPESEYEYYNSVDAFGTPVASTTLESKVVGEYFSSLKFHGSGGLITISADLSKGTTNLDIDSKVYIRNW